MARTIKRYLVLNAYGDVRVRTRPPSRYNVPLGEIVWPITFHVPPGWGQIVEPVDLEMPGPAEIEVGEAEVHEPAEATIATDLGPVLDEVKE